MRTLTLTEEEMIKLGEKIEEYELEELAYEALKALEELEV
jgi:hypothetical protein